MKYANIFHAIESALAVEGYDAPVPTIDPASLEGEVFDHAKKPAGELTRLDWVAHHGMTHRLIIDTLGGRGRPQYLALVNRYCYEPARRTQARIDIMQHLPQRLPRLKRAAVVALWSGMPGITYALIDCGDGTKTSTLQGHINEVRRELDRLHKGAIDHLSRVLADAGLIHDEELTSVS